MNQKENEVFEEMKAALGVIESPEENEKTKAGKFIAGAVALFKRFAKGQLSAVLLKIIPLLMARIINLESKADRIIDILDEKKP